MVSCESSRNLWTRIAGLIGYHGCFCTWLSTGGAAATRSGDRRPEFAEPEPAGPVDCRRSEARRLDSSATGRSEAAGKPYKTKSP